MFKQKQKNYLLQIRGRSEDHEVTWTNRLAYPVRRVRGEQKQGRLCCPDLKVQKNQIEECYSSNKEIKILVDHSESIFGG